MEPRPAARPVRPARRGVLRAGLRECGDCVVRRRAPLALEVRREEGCALAVEEAIGPDLVRAARVAEVAELVRDQGTVRALERLVDAERLRRWEEVVGPPVL